MSPVQHSDPLPAGYRLVPVRTTYLEMTETPRLPPIPLPFGSEVKRWRRPGPVEYQRLFRAVGGEWGWSGRLIMAEEELRALLLAEENEVHLLYAGCQVAGFAEIDRRVARQAEIAYFGLLPAFIGRGLGRFFLDWAVRRAWKGETRRVWLHTCEYDHPQALKKYQQAGFAVFGEKTETQPYPEEFLARRAPGA